jgi:hypothetical protein
MVLYLDEFIVQVLIAWTEDIEGWAPLEEVWW